MRYCASLLLLLTLIISCSKKDTERSNFAEITLGSQKFVFDSLEAVFDTSTHEKTCNVRLFDRSSNSHMSWETSSGTKWINGTYIYPAIYYLDRTVVFLSIQTYVNWVPGTYYMSKSLTMTIDQSENGRMHGTFSGTVTCLTCNPYGIEVDLSGEFEMPYSYR